MSISTESTTNEGDKTADPEWPPNFANLDPSEEMHLLSARIAQLKRQQTTNSSTSSATKVGNADTLGDRNKISEEVHGETQINIAEFVRYHEKMELELKEELKTKELKALRTELEHQKLLIAHNALQTKMEEYQKQLQQTTEMKQLEGELKDMKELKEELKQYKEELEEELKDIKQYKEELKDIKKEDESLSESGIIRLELDRSPIVLRSSQFLKHGQ
uniref:Coiled-coil domain containing 73 n=1 Tax=Globodera pallida TaxID=36090 RepID=A0A183CHD2_GLOPA